VIFLVDEKSQIQALDRLVQCAASAGPGGTACFEYSARTLSLYAALNVVHGPC